MAAPTVPSDTPRPAPGPVDGPEVRGWQLYGLANAAFVTTCVGALAGPYLTDIARKTVCATHPGASCVFSGHNADANTTAADTFTAVGIGPLHIQVNALYPYLIAAATVVQVLILPYITARGDREARRPLLAATTAFGVVFTVLLLVIPQQHYKLACLDFALALISYGCASAVYNAMLNDVAAPADRDDVSARAYAVSYLGGGTLLLLNLVLVSVHSALGLGGETAVRICIASAGVWWAVFGYRAIRRLQPRVPAHPGRGTKAQLIEVRDVLRQLPGTRRFLISYLFFNDAIQTTVTLASTVITHELFHGIASDAATFLFVLLLLIQLIAAPGAALSARLARRLGAQETLERLLVAWCVIILAAYFMVTSKPLVFVLGVAIAIVLGGSGSLTRSLFSRLIPPGQEAVFFGVYQIAERGTAWLAALLFAIVVSVTGSYRGAIASLVGIFVVGLVLLRRCDVDEAGLRAEAFSTERAS